TFPTNHKWYSFSATESYRGVHEWIQAAFAALRIETELASVCKKAVAGHCFAGYEKFDLLWRGQKIAGAAQRRTRGRWLIQGSVQPPPLRLAKKDWQKAMRDVARISHRRRWSDFEMDNSLIERATELARRKYSQAIYNQKR